MNLSALLDRLFQRQNITSGTQVKQRLKFILAHDRAAIEPQVFDNMRHEIMRVVSRYVELVEGSLDIRLESDKRMTALIANLPIRMVREELPDLVSFLGEPSGETDLSSEQADPLALEMDQFAEEALDAIAAKEKPKESPKSIIEKPNLEDIGIAERNIKLNSELRNAADKSQNDDNSDRSIAQNELDKDSSIENSEEPDDQPSDQLELSLGVSSDDLASNEIVVDLSSELHS